METILMLVALVVLILMGVAIGCCTLPSKPSESFTVNYGSFMGGGFVIAIIVFVIIIASTKVLGG